MVHARAARRPALVRVGLLGAEGVKRTERLRTETAAVNHVARHQAGGLRFHDLRHSYATWLVDEGVPPNMVLRVLGHERASTTLDLYTRRTDNSDRILQALNDVSEEPAGDDATTASKAPSLPLSNHFSPQ